MNYRCIKTFTLDRFSVTGFRIEGDPVIIQEGTEFFLCDEHPFFTAEPAVRLENDDGQWIEIHPTILDEYFEEVDDY